MYPGLEDVSLQMLSTSQKPPLKYGSKIDEWNQRGVEWQWGWNRYPHCVPLGTYKLMAQVRGTFMGDSITCLGLIQWVPLYGPTVDTFSIMIHAIIFTRIQIVPWRHIGHMIQGQSRVFILGIPIKCERIQKRTTRNKNCKQELRTIFTVNSGPNPLYDSTFSPKNSIQLFSCWTFKLVLLSLLHKGNTSFSQNLWCLQCTKNKQKKPTQLKCIPLLLFSYRAVFTWVENDTTNS